MKKITNVLALALVLLTLGACSTANNAANTEASSSASSQVESLKATFVIKESDDKVSQKEVTFTQDQTVMEVMKKEFKIEETDGFITAIDGVSQDEASKTYWMYNVNGELAPKGAAETKLSAGDTVEFYLQKF